MGQTSRRRSFQWIQDELFGCLVAVSAMITTPPASRRTAPATTLATYSPITEVFGCIAARTSRAVDCGGRGAAAFFDGKD